MRLTDDVRSKIDEAVVAFAEEQGLPSLALGVVSGSDVVHRSMAATNGGVLPSADTPFRIASMTKSFTAAAVLLLRDRGGLRLDDAVVDLAPELAAMVGPTSDSPPVTVRQLLAMNAGLATDDPWADRLLDADAATMDALLARGATFAATPGTTFVYSNFGYAMLGRIITQVAGRPFQHVITDELLVPLGLADTGWDQPTSRAGRPAPAQPWWRVDGTLVAEPILGDGGFASMGGLWSTVNDLARWCSFMLDAFPARDDPDHAVLARATRREMQQVATGQAPIVRVEADGTRVQSGGYGFGLNVVHDSRLGAVVGHSGGLPGFGSNMRWLPHHGVAVVALANLRYARAGMLTSAVLDLLSARGVLVERPMEPPPALSRIGEELVTLLNDWTTERAATLFAFNVDLDEPLSRRRSAAEARHVAHGPLRVRSLRTLNRAEADLVVVDDRGVEMTLSLMASAEPEPRVQWYELEEPKAQDPSPG